MTKHLYKQTARLRVAKNNFMTLPFTKWWHTSIKIFLNYQTLVVPFRRETMLFTSQPQIYSLCITTGLNLTISFRTNRKIFNIYFSASNTVKICLSPAWENNATTGFPAKWSLRTELLIVVLREKFASTNQKHCLDPGSDMPWVWNFCARSSHVISRETNGSVEKCRLFVMFIYPVIIKNLNLHVQPIIFHYPVHPSSWTQTRGSLYCLLTPGLI